MYRVYTFLIITHTEHVKLNCSNVIFMNQIESHCFEVMEKWSAEPLTNPWLMYIYIQT